MRVGRRPSTEEPSNRPSTTERRAFMRGFEEQFPPLGHALVTDARIFCAGRGERFQFRSRADGLLQAARLCWSSDAFFSLACYRAKASLQKHDVPILPALLHRLAMMVGQVCIGSPVVLAAGVYLPHGQVVIDGIVNIGKNVEIRPWVTIGLKEGNVQGATIEPGVRIGTGAKIVGPVHIGRGAIIGANAVVVRDVPAGATVVGVPARILDK
jgi:serine O-acetyltransferase